MSAKEEPGLPKTEEKKEDEQINLKVQNSDGTEVFFKIKKATPLRKLMDAYCQRQSINPNSIRFLYDGQRLQSDKTPKDYDMDNNDMIDVVIEQLGGC